MLPDINKVFLNTEEFAYKDSVPVFDSGKASRKSISCPRDVSKEFLQKTLLATKIKSFLEHLLEKRKMSFEDMSRNDFRELMKLMGLKLSYTQATEGFLVFRGDKLEQSTDFDVMKLCKWIVDNLKVLAHNNIELIHQFKSNVKLQRTMSKTMFKNFQTISVKPKRDASVKFEKRSENKIKVTYSGLSSPKKKRLHSIETDIGLDTDKEYNSHSRSIDRIKVRK